MAITIVRGEQRSFKLKVRDIDTQDPIDLSSATVTVVLPGGTTASSAAVSGNGNLGTVLVSMTEAETTALPLGAGLNIELTYVISSVTRIVQFKQCLTVVDQLY